MGHILSSLLLALSGNVDNLAVGIAYGVNNLQIRFLANVLIAAVSSGGTAISMLAGVAISKFLPDGDNMSFRFSGLWSGILSGVLHY